MMLSRSRNTGAPIKPSIPLPELIEDIRDIDNFHRLFAKDKVLGEGADGMVCSYTHTTSNCVVAVKIPVENPKRNMTKALLGEMKKMELLGDHPNIVTMLASFASHVVSGPSRGPALFLPFFPLGDLSSYAFSLHRQQIKEDMPQRIPEVTVWKFFKDLSLGLNFLHNENNLRFVHNDLKPDNILVASPNNWDLKNGIPAEPTFQISDFGRLAQCPGTDRWSGTCEYAPPLSEQRGPVKPSADIWSLGATIQWFLFDEHPTQSREAFIASRKKQGLDYPDIYNENAWKDQYWRELRPTVYRPLDVYENELKKKYDAWGKFPEDFEPYSTPLNAWYSALWNQNESERITSATLVEHLVPWTDSMIAIKKETELADLCFQKAQKIRVAVRAKQAARLGKFVQEPIKERKAPSYGGNSWREHIIS
jgi:serine/threonine protein kinase